MIKTDQVSPFYKTMAPTQALERAVSDYLSISRNKNNKFMFGPHNYWPAEETAWTRLEEALQRVEEEKSANALDN